MRRALIAFILAGAGIVLGQTNLASAPPRITARERTELQSRRPQRIKLAEQFMEGEQTERQLQTGTAFAVKTAVLDSIGGLHVRMDQKYNGVRIAGAQTIVHLDRSDRVKGITGEAIRDLALDTVPKVGEQEAVDLVKLDFLPGGGKMRSTAELIVHMPSDPAQQDRKTVNGAALAWKVRASADETTSMFYLVDAHSGRILKKESAEYSIEYSTVAGTGQSGRFTSDVPFSIAQADPPPNPYTGPYRLLDPSRGNNKVVNMELKAPSEEYGGHPYWSPSTHFGAPAHFNYETMSTWGPEGIGSGVDAAVGMQRIWDMLANVFGQDGIDGDGRGMISRVHIRKKTNEPYGDAYWNGTEANFGNTTEGSRTHMTTVGHEFGHALFQYMLGEDNFSGEARGLNEGHGDIMGSLVYIYEKELNGVGGQFPTQVPLNLITGRIVNPLGYWAGDAQGLAYYVNNMGQKEEHTQGTAYGHAWVFLAFGASPAAGDDRYSMFLPNGMAGIGVHKAAEIWRLALAGYMDSSPTFYETRNAYIDAATELYGANSIEVKAVKNAFSGIGVGFGATDTANPTVSMNNPVVNENEQSAYVAMTSGDDVGVMRMELRLNDVLVKTVDGFDPDSWAGYISIEGLPPGAHTLRATAFDSAGKSKDVQKQITLNGRNRLILNGTFEAGTASWTRSHNGIFMSNADASFLDSGFVMFGAPGQYIYQTVTIPASATAATLSYRIRSEKHPSVLPFEQLRVDVLNNSGVVLEVLENYTNYTPLGDAPSKGYRHSSHSLAAFAGQTVRIRFVSVSAMPARFKLDNVSLVWSGPVDANMQVDVDEAEGSVTFLVTNIVNIGAGQVKDVRLLVNGAVAHTWSSPPYIAVVPTSALVKNANYTAKAQIRNMSNVVVGTTEITNFMVHDVTNLLKSADFESNAIFNWSRTGGTEIAVDGGETMIYNSFLGSRHAKMDGSPSATQTLKQQVYLPGDADVITLGFRVRTDSPQFDVNDLFTVRILNTNDQVLAVPLVLPAIVVTNQPFNYKGYVRFKLNLTSLKGQMVRIEFRSVHIAPKPTVFYIDNTSLVAKKFGVATAQ